MCVSSVTSLCSAPPSGAQGAAIWWSAVQDNNSPVHGADRQVTIGNKEQNSVGAWLLYC